MLTNFTCITLKDNTTKNVNFFYYMNTQSMRQEKRPWSNYCCGTINSPSKYKSCFTRDIVKSKTVPRIDTDNTK